MPLVPHFLRPAPLARVDDPWPSVGRSRRRMLAPAPTAESGASPHRDAPRHDEPAPEQDEMPAAPARVEERVPVIDTDIASPATNLAAAMALRDAMTAPPQRDSAAQSREEDRFICDMLSLARLCPRVACRKAHRCRGHPLCCLDTTGEAVPAEAREWVERLLEAGENGESLDELEAAFPEEQLAYRCWVAALNARITRDRSRSRRRAAPLPPGSAP